MQQHEANAWGSGLQLDKMSRIFARECLELNCFDVHDIDIYKFYNNQFSGFFSECFCLADDNGVATSSFNKNIKLAFYLFCS